MDVARNTLSIRNCTDFSEATLLRYAILPYPIHPTLRYATLSLIMTLSCLTVQIVVEGLIRSEPGTFIGVGKPGGRGGWVVG